MLDQTNTLSPYLTADGRINMAHVMREAHMRTKAQLAFRVKNKYEPGPYADEFRYKLADELATARIMQRRYFPGRGKRPTHTFLPVVVTYHGRTFVEYQITRITP
jgi:hypothetical protein